MTAVAVSAVSPIIPYFPNSAGAPYSGARVFTYAAGTLTKLATYTDSTGLTPQTNPLVINASGFVEGSGGQPGDIWLQSGIPYKLVYAPPGTDDPPSSSIWTVDNVMAGGSGGSSAGGVIYGAGAPTFAASQGQLYGQTDGPPGGSLWQSLGIGTQNLETIMLADGAAHVYPLAETSGTVATDVVAVSPSNGAYTGSFTLSQPALSADQTGAALFSGGKVALTITDSPAVASFTVEFLCEPTTEPSGNLVANDSPSSSNKGFAIKTNGSNGFLVNFGCANGPVQMQSGTYASFDGVTFHVVMTFDSVNHILSLYINGVLVNTFGGTGAYATGTDDIWFAKNPATGAGAFTGEMQLVGLYPSVLSQTQITNHYKARFANNLPLWFVVGSMAGLGGSAGTGTSGASPLQTANFLVSNAYTTWRVNTTSNVIAATMPAVPADGDIYTFTDSLRTFGTNALTITANAGQTIAVGSTTASTMVLNISGQFVTLQWNAATNVWDQA